jgi:two-component system OmpR family sensor kinase
MGADRVGRHTRQGEYGLDTRLMFRLELPAVLALTFVLLFLVSWAPIRNLLPEEEIYRLAGLAAAGAAASAGIVAAVTAKISLDRTMHVVASALAFYGLVVMPLSVTKTSPNAPIWLHGALFGASLSFLGLMALAMTERHGTWAIGWRGVAAGFLCTVFSGLLSAQFGSVASALSASEWAGGVTLLGWFALAVLFISRGVLASDSVTWRIGLGLGVIAIAHLLRAAGEGRVISPDVPFFALRLLGLLVLLAALGLYARQVVLDQKAKQTEEYTRLQAATLAAERAAEFSRERDHELRNVVAGLSGAAHLLGSGEPKPGFDLTAAVAAELKRLSALLERPVTPGAMGSTPVPELLTRLVMLRRVAGAEMDLEAPGTLRVAMPPEPLAQVVSNLLVNCARYAPGAPVRVRAWSDGVNGSIEIADSGPGIAAAQFEYGTGEHGTGAHGTGIGLAVSSRLLAEHGGSLRLVPQTADRRGCTALIEIPLATAPSPSPASARRGVLVPGAV